MLNVGPHPRPLSTALRGAVGRGPAALALGGWGCYTFPVSYVLACAIRPQPHYDVLTEERGIPVHFDLPELLKAAGYLGLFAIIFAESGLLIGFFLPGDSLLFTAGFLASQTNPLTGKPFFDILPLVLGCFIAAVAGDSVGYAFGYRVGRPLFDRPNSLVFRREHLMKAEAFYERHGGKAIILARFLPVVRTFAPIVAGVAHMDYPRFLAYNLVGGLLWGVGVTLAGYFLGSLIPDPDRYLLPVIALIVLSSAVPSIYHVVKEYRHDALAYVRRRLGGTPDVT